MKTKPNTQLATAPSEDALKGAQLTAQYHRATGGMKEVVIFGAMMMLLREEYPELAQKGGDRKSKSTRGLRSEDEPITLSKWLETHAPEVKRTTALRFLHVTQAIAEDYAQIVGPKIAKTISLQQLVTTPADDLQPQAAAKQLELFEWVNGTSQRSWLDRFSPDSPQKRGAANRDTTPRRPPTPEELAKQATEEITELLNLIDAWFTAGHHTRIERPIRLTADAIFEEASKKLRAVK
jgi:hypothetical protein